MEQQRNDGARKLKDINSRGNFNEENNIMSKYLP